MKPGRAWVMIGLLVATLGFYLAPWYRHTTAGFTMNAFDLAEWASIHPAVRSSHPPLLTTFLLRVPMAVICVGLVLAARGLRSPGARLAVLGAAGLIALRLLPPVEFLTSARGDPNYRQMLLLTAMTGGGMLLALAAGSRFDRWRVWGIAALLLVAGAVGWWGLSRAGVLLDNFEIEVQIGVGAVGYLLCAGGMLAVALWAGQGEPKRRLTPEMSEAA